MQEDKKELIVASYLTTKEDLCDYQLAMFEAAANKTEKTVFTILSFLMILSGLLGKIFISKTYFTDVIFALLVLCGFLVGFYYSTLQPYCWRAKAISYYEAHSEKLIAQTVAFYQDKITITNDRYEASLPYGMLYRCYENDKMFLLYTGIAEIRFIPKRALQQEECQKIHEILQEQLKEKFKQEGAR